MIETFPIPIEDLIQDPSLTELDLEDQLNLETEDVDSADAARRKALFQNNFLLNDAVLPENPIKISRAQLEVLYDKEKHFPTNKKCLTGLLIHFASKIESNKNIFYPLFQPVSLILSTDVITANGNFANKYANRSHLCPPCAEFAYTLQS